MELVKKFIKNIDSDTIIMQINHILKDMNIEDVDIKGKRFQIMFMSMGEPFLNYDNVKEAIIKLHDKYPNAELLVSTIAPKMGDKFADFIALSSRIPNIGLQFSIHRSNNDERDDLIPYKNKYTLEEIRDYGIIWWHITGRHPYLNYCIDGNNSSYRDFARLQSLFSPVIFNFTFSVVCSSDENMKDAGFKNLDAIRYFEKYFIESGYNTRIFNPDGQDDIGGGCGQLWYVQKWLGEHNKKKQDINCIGCIHYNIMYQEKPKMVFDGCVLYDTYLKRDKDDRVVPCTICNNAGNIKFLDIRDAYKRRNKKKK